MKRRDLLKFCRALPHATEDIKWGNDLVFSIGGKMFACFDNQGAEQVSFKTAPETFAELTRLPGVVPAPYAARFHWVLVRDLGALPGDALAELVRQAYTIVASGLPKKKQRELGLEDPEEFTRPSATRKPMARPKVSAVKRAQARRPKRSV